MKYKFLEELGVKEININGACLGPEWLGSNGKVLKSINPTYGQKIAEITQADEYACEVIITEAVKAFKDWRSVPMPERGKIVRQLGDELKIYKEPLGALVSLEMGKILEEGKGEVQEMIDACYYSDGLSRQPHGKVLPSERPDHFMLETWHPLGPVGVISAFNFPVAVWAWNAAIAVTHGDPVIWKPSSQTPLSAIAVQNICNKVMEKNGLKGIFNLVIGSGSTVGEKLIRDIRIPLISATGSCRMGHHVREVVAKKRSSHPPLLELGGNNAVIVMKDANLDEAVEKIMQAAILFGAYGTAGQRCTTTRRVIMQNDIAKKLPDKLVKFCKQIKIGDPLEPGTLMGPLVTQIAVDGMMNAMDKIKEQGGKIIYGGRELPRDGFFVEPTLVLANKNMPIVKEETFAPILYLMEFDTLEEAIEINNSVPQGLSSSIFTTNLRNAFHFISARGSDCGIANINVGTSGAEIGGGFGGEKETGGGREMGSDSWKAYMRRQTITINASGKLPLAQGIKFG